MERSTCFLPTHTWLWGQAQLTCREGGGPREMEPCEKHGCLVCGWCVVLPLEVSSQNQLSSLRTSLAMSLRVRDVAQKQLMAAVVALEWVWVTQNLPSPAAHAWKPGTGRRVPGPRVAVPRHCPAASQASAWGSLGKGSAARPPAVPQLGMC